MKHEVNKAILKGSPNVHLKNNDYQFENNDYSKALDIKNIPIAKPEIITIVKNEYLIKPNSYDI